MTSFRAAAPIFPVRRLAAALEHYRRLGFETFSNHEGYGFAHRDDVWLHLAEFDQLDPLASNSAAYLYVDDADALSGTWRASGVEGRFAGPVDTDYGLREGAHIDPDGNLIRFGSWLPGHAPR
jgi:hypothetical protein